MDITAIGSSINSTTYKTCSINTCTTEIAANKNNADKVSISDEALKANFFPVSGFVDYVRGDEITTMEGIRSFRDKNIEQAQSIIRETLNSLNISDYEKLQVNIDEYGSVIVTGDTDENNKTIAEALQKDDRFRNTWNDCSESSSFLAAREAAIPYHEAYFFDPKAAVEQYSWLFDKEWDFNMYFEDGKVGYSVT